MFFYFIFHLTTSSHIEEQAHIHILSQTKEKSYKNQERCEYDMGYNKDVYIEADKVMQERRNNAVRNAERKKELFYSKYPQAKQLEDELSSTLTKVTRAMLRNSIDLRTALENLKDENLKTQEMLNDMYIKAGISEKDLELQYSCIKCKDKGNIDGRICSCYKQLLKEVACKNLNKLSQFKFSTFSTFKLEYYSDEKHNNEQYSEREKIGKYFNYCKKYANSFNRNSKNIFMRGNTGLGKTHLSMAIARQVIENGFGVIYCSTPDIVSKIESEHFGKIEDGNTLNVLNECDLLILDDLGTEFQTSFTRTTVYNIINSRLIINKPTIINTNLDFEELEKIYSPRLVSRIMGEYVVMNFVGKDIRQAKRFEKYK